MSWRRFFRRASWDRDRAEELRSYLEIETDENIARGMSREAARRAAHVKLGNTVRIREEISPIVFNRNGLSLDGGFGFWSLARLKPGMTIADANADIARTLPIWLSAWPIPPPTDRCSRIGGSPRRCNR
jgi:hypothetical protein